MIDDTALVASAHGRAAGHPAAGRAVRPGDGGVLPRRAEAGRAAVHRQHLPVPPGVQAPKFSTLLGRIPSTVGYQPTLADEMGAAAARADHVHPRPLDHLHAGDLRATWTTSPTRPRTRCSRTWTPPRCSPSVHREGIYPAVDPLELHLPRILDPHGICRPGPLRRRPAPCKPILQRYKELQGIIADPGHRQALA